MTAPRLILGHGASGTAASMRPHVDGLRRRGIAAAAVDLPKGLAERAVPRFREAAGPDAARAAVGGHSYGGRVASMLASEEEVAALVLLSYPLHRPGAHADRRTAHWGSIRCPVLFLSGERDQFARVYLLRSDVARLLPDAELHT
ncbi:MAG TPA: alpha/beta family hydrolase, partial [Candidatus Dormibacteraeota bacterium]|nr:alpha/beta family hydrolase [Candidatus Dormibacteraeota bacterium]